MSETISGCECDGEVGCGARDCTAKPALTPRQAYWAAAAREDARRGNEVAATLFALLAEPSESERRARDIVTRNLRRATAGRAATIGVARGGNGTNAQA